jgi:hypothetical protein
MRMVRKKDAYIHAVYWLRFSGDVKERRRSSFILLCTPNAQRFLVILTSADPPQAQGKSSGTLVAKRLEELLINEQTCPY